jgi:2,4-dichlorophenol 6-monooxygenase
VDFATFSFFNHLSVGGGFGMLPGASEEHNRAVLAELFSDSRRGEMRRAQLEEMLYTLRREFQHAAYDLGFNYGQSPVVTSDATPAPAHDPVGHSYQPTTRPGDRLPHAWLQRDGVEVSTHDLLSAEAFLLLAGPDGQAWCDAATQLADERSLPVIALRVGGDGELQDVLGTWADLCGHGDGGAVLVRPDGHVAFRPMDLAGDPRTCLLEALEIALGRSSTPAVEPVAVGG